MRRMHKKGALELSINAIVIVILAMTLLGLGLGFIKSMMGNTLKLSDSTFNKMKDQLQSDLMNGNQILTFTQKKFVVDKGGASLEGFGIKNTKDGALNYGIMFHVIDCPETAKVNGHCKSDINTWFRFIKTPGAYSVKAGEMDIKSVDMKIPKSADAGDYLVELIAYEGVSTGVDDDCDKLIDIAYTGASPSIAIKQTFCEQNSCVYTKAAGSVTESCKIYYDCSTLGSADCGAKKYCSWDGSACKNPWNRYASTELFITVQ